MKAKPLFIVWIIVITQVTIGVALWMSSALLQATPTTNITAPAKTPGEAVKDFIADFELWNRTFNYSSEPPAYLLSHFAHNNTPNDKFWSFLSDQHHSSQIEYYYADAPVDSKLTKAIITSLYVSGTNATMNREYIYRLVAVPNGWLIDSIQSVDPNGKQNQIARVTWDLNSTHFVSSMDLKSKETPIELGVDNHPFQEAGTIVFPSGKVVFLTGAVFGFEYTSPFQLRAPTTKAHVGYIRCGGGASAIRIAFSDPNQAVHVLKAECLDNTLREAGAVFGIADAKDFLQISPADLVKMEESTNDKSFFDFVPNHPHDAMLFKGDTYYHTYAVFPYWGVDKEGKPVYLLLVFKGLYEGADCQIMSQSSTRST